MKRGDAFLMSAPPRYIRHLYIVISDPAKNSGKYVIVNITGDRFRCGEECVLNIGDHPWIKKKSFVAFADALEITPSQAARIQHLVTKKSIVIKESVNSAVLERIIKAAKESKAIPENFKKYL